MLTYYSYNPSSLPLHVVTLEAQGMTQETRLTRDGYGTNDTEGTVTNFYFIDKTIGRTNGYSASTSVVEVGPSYENTLYQTCDQNGCSTYQTQVSPEVEFEDYSSYTRLSTHTYSYSNDFVIGYGPKSRYISYNNILTTVTGSIYSKTATCTLKVPYFTLYEYNGKPLVGNDTLTIQGTTTTNGKAATYEKLSYSFMPFTGADIAAIIPSLIFKDDGVYDVWAAIEPKNGLITDVLQRISQDYTLDLERFLSQKELELATIDFSETIDSSQHVSVTEKIFSYEVKTTTLNRPSTAHRFFFSPNQINFTGNFKSEFTTKQLLDEIEGETFLSDACHIQSFTDNAVVFDGNFGYYTNYYYKDHVFWGADVADNYSLYKSFSCNGIPKFLSTIEEYQEVYTTTTKNKVAYTFRKDERRADEYGLRDERLILGTSAFTEKALSSALRKVEKENFFSTRVYNTTTEGLTIENKHRGGLSYKVITGPNIKLARSPQNNLTYVTPVGAKGFLAFGETEGNGKQVYRNIKAEIHELGKESAHKLNLNNLEINIKDLKAYLRENDVQVIATNDSPFTADAIYRNDEGITYYDQQFYSLFDANPEKLDRAKLSPTLRWHDTREDKSEPFKITGTSARLDATFPYLSNGKFKKAKASIGVTLEDDSAYNDLTGYGKGGTINAYIANNYSNIFSTYGGFQPVKGQDASLYGGIGNFLETVLDSNNKSSTREIVNVNREIISVYKNGEVVVRFGRALFETNITTRDLFLYNNYYPTYFDYLGYYYYNTIIPMKQVERFFPWDDDGSY